VKYLIAGVLAGAALAAPRKQTFTGIVTDELCAKTGHAAMRMGPTDAECTIACVDVHGTSYVLLAATRVYALDDQKMPEQFAGRKVKVVGVLDTATRTIHVTSIKSAK
jgi:hypothetical protein